MYRQYREQYQSAGRLAMENTMGAAASLTGGYGSSYSQQAGQQAYNVYLQKLNEVVPELYAQARSQYDREGSALSERYARISSRERATMTATATRCRIITRHCPMRAARIRARRSAARIWRCSMRSWRTTITGMS